MRRGKSLRNNQRWLKRFGANLERLIHKRGYKSIYDFWVHHGDDVLSRSSLHRIVRGESEPKITTVRDLAILLKVRISELTEFD